MSEMVVLQDLLIMFALSVAAVVAFHRVKLPPVVGFLITGIICGPYGLGLIGRVHEVEALAEIGVVLLLFTVGMEFSLEKLTRLRALLVIGGGLQVLLTMGATTLLGRAAGLSWPMAVFLGMLVSLSSTAVVIRLLSERGELDSPHAHASLGILIFQDLCVVPMVLLTPVLAGKQQGIGPLLLIGAKAILFIGLAVVAARYVVPFILHQVVRTGSREAFLLTIILLGLGAAWATAWVGLSLALGAFIAGLVISESEYSHQALGETLPLREVFNSLFFVSIGMLFDVRTLLGRPLLVIEGVLLIIALKALIGTGVVLLLRRSLRVALVVGLGLAQIGEFSFVLSRTGAQAGLLNDELNQVFLAASVGTMALTPGLMALSPRLSMWAGRYIGRGRRREEESGPAASLLDHVVVIGYGENGRNLTRVLEHVGTPYVVIEMNDDTVRAERAKGVPIVFGDAVRPEVLGHAALQRAMVAVIAISDPAATREVVHVARRLNPNLHIIVRTRYIRDMQALQELGAQEVVPEELGTSIEIFARVLTRYRVPQEVIDRCVRQVRQDGYALLRAVHGGAAPQAAGFLEEMSLEERLVTARSPLCGKRLRESGLRERSGAILVAIQRRDGERVVPPGADDVLEEGDRVLVLGRPESLAAAGALFGAAEEDSA
jgi:CPA2 family monovalent cation:H+ antiporter-2